MGKIVFKNVVCQIRDYDSLFFTKTEQNSDPKHTFGPLPQVLKILKS